LEDRINEIIKDNQPKHSILRYCPSNIFIQDFNSLTSFLIIDLKLKKEYNQQNDDDVFLRGLIIDKNEILSIVKGKIIKIIELLFLIQIFQLKVFLMQKI
jgi:hypothetical protein